MKKESIDLMKGWIRSPIKWVEDIFGLQPPRLKEGYVVGENTRLEDIRAEWFEEFREGEEITWQQWVMFLGVERGLKGGKRFISIASGHGVGKSSTMSWILLWFLMCYEEAQIACTAPTAQQMYDVLWKEVAKWHGRMPEEIKGLYEVESNYIRIKVNPKTWFARAATARKESAEALAGIHGKNVMLLVDEASSVPEEIFISAEGSLTNRNIFVFVISNYTRLSGYFHQSQENKYGEWQTLQFSSEDSPIVEEGFCERMKRRGEESSEYRVRVLGLPPVLEEDYKGYMPLLAKGDLRFEGGGEMIQPIILGVDPSGEGRAQSAFVIRDPFRAQVLGVEKGMGPVKVARKIVEIMEFYKIMPENVVIDSFGPGADVIGEFMKMRRWIQGVLVGKPAQENERFTNIRAELYWREREWILKGGILVGTFEQWEDVLSNRYTSEGGRIKMMSKKMMRDLGIKSPDVSDALSLTFLREEWETPRQEWEKEVEVEGFDPFYGI